MTSPPRRSSSSMTAWKTRPRFAVSSSAPRCEPELVRERLGQRREARDVGEERGALDAVGHLEVARERPAPVPGDVRLGIVAGQVDGALDGGGHRTARALCGSLSMGTPVRPYTRPVTGRVFRRSLDPDLPVAVEARDATIRDAAGREYLDAAGGAIVVNVGHGRASIAAVLGEQDGPPRVRPRLGVHDRAARGLRRARSGRACRSTTRRSTRSAAARRRSRRR